MKIRIIIIFLILLIGATACKNKYEKAADEIISHATDLSTINVGQEKYELHIPNGWTTEYREVYGVNCYYLMAPKTKDDPNTNINVANEFMQNLNLEDYLAGTIQSIKKAIPSAVILGQGEIFANSLKGVWYSYNIQPQGIKATLIAYIFPKNGFAYTITAGTQTKDTAKYRKTFDDVAKSFKFINE